MFSMRFSSIVSLVALFLAVSGAVAAVNPADIKQRMGAGDPVAGKAKSVLCQSCHGETGNSSASNYPKLAGQFASYIQKQVHEFQDGTRKDPMMTAMAQSAGGDQDIQDIAAYFASQKQMKGSRRGMNRADRKAYKRGKLLFGDGGNACYTCHGKKGKGITPGASQAPVIGGQHKAYIIKQLKAFGQRTRTNDPGGMMGMIAGLLAVDDIEALATYISTL